MSEAGAMTASKNQGGVAPLAMMGSAGRCPTDPSTNAESSLIAELRRAETCQVLIVRALPGLGDMLCGIPAVRALRRALPGARISLLGLPWARSFASRFPRYFDEFIELPGYPGIWEPAAGYRSLLPGFFASVRARKFDLALQLHGSGVITNPFTLQLGAKKAAGFYKPGYSCPDPERFFPYPENEPEIRRNLRLMERLGAASTDDGLEFPIHTEDLAELARYVRHDLRPGAYVCIHPGASAPARRWLPERFARVGALLAGRGFDVVLTGSEAEAELNEEVGRRMRAPFYNLAGPMGVGALAALIAGARLVVANDTGVSHLAAAMRVPSVIVFTAADPARWAPLDSARHHPVFVPVDCRPCNYTECPIGHPCANGVTAGTVLREVAALLGKERLRVA